MLNNQIIYSLIIFPFLVIFSILISKRLNLVDIPSSRKIHKLNIVNTSGFISSLFLLFVVKLSEFSVELENIIIAGFFVSIIGFIDDRIELKPSTKIILILMPCVYLILHGFELTDLGKYEIIEIIYLGKFSFFFTLLASILLINAINYTDGTDGLLISYCLISILYFYFLSDKQSQYLQIFLILIFILIVLLIFNFLPAKSGFKSFLGDSGSLFFGFLISFSMIYLYKYEKVHPAYLIWATWIPIYDFLFVTFLRVKNKVSFSVPDNSHFHHYIFKLFSKSHLKTFLSISLINSVVIFVGYFICLIFGKIYSLTLFVILFPFFCLIRAKLLKK
tara:strand:+ start:603 stop:1604 length:1002 start_codon:yes stop_codon:yes gene_type:complete